MESLHLTVILFERWNLVKLVFDLLELFLVYFSRSVRGQALLEISSFGLPSGTRHVPHH